MKMNINMKKIVFFLLVQFVAIGAFAQEAAIKEAEVAYTKKIMARLSNSTKGF